VTDGTGTTTTETSSASSLVTVTPATRGSSTSEFPWTWLYEGVVLAAIAALVAGALIALGRRRGPPRTLAEPPVGPEQHGPTLGSTPAGAPPVYLEMPEAVALPLPPPPPIPSGFADPLIPSTIAPGTVVDADSDVDAVMAELDEIRAAVAKRDSKKFDGSPAEDPAGSGPAP
ncbi:MAG: hypothetical protein ACREDE_09445, partial [Thermoplasmata archaeon]